MEYALRVIVETVAVNSQEVVKRETIKTHAITTPASMIDSGLRHAERVSLLEKMPPVLLAVQAVRIDVDYKRCPSCAQTIKKNRYAHSQFHAAFSDHQIRLQKHRRSHLDCRWQRFPIMSSVFGTNIHSDLARLQYLMRDTKKPEKCNGPGKGRIMSYKLEP